jgi:predicted glycogen debranching enzyme
MIDSREWLEPDGLGGYAMGCADGIRTRRYHALLLVATQPPDGRMVLVADVEVYVETAHGKFALSSHRYRGDVVHPDGASHLAAFAWQPWPRWIWKLPDGTEIAGELVVAPGAPRVALRWTALRGDARRLEVRPFVSGRDYHSLHHENSAFAFDAEVAGERVTWRPYHGVPAVAALSDGEYHHAPAWYRAFRYSEEVARGLDAEEDLVAPGMFAFDLARGPAHIAFGTGWAGETAAAFVDGTYDAERTRRAGYASPLHRAADAYIVARGSGRTIIAGYPWFGDWGRDTFISLRGLCLATGRRDVARDILMQWTTMIDRGMLPNRFSEASGSSSPEYNSVDAALWFAIAADAYLAGAATADDRRALETAIDAIVAGYAGGTRHRIAADSDGLLACGEPGVQLTWMDARVDGREITPRIGKPVEIQALWINALEIAGRRDARWRQLAERARASFVQRFWDPARRQLYDVIDCDHVPGAVDSSCRPNQIFAVGGLPRATLDGDPARAVVDTVERVLVTPAGPRTLAPTDPNYHPRYGGNPRERDEAYHNGTVWPWLSGAFVDAWLRVHGDTPATRADARRRFIEPLLARAEIAGLGHISEICEGEAPHRPVGCPFQAWSVAEALRLSST